MLRVAAARGVPIVLMHNRAEARYRNVVAEVVADLQRALDRALDAGIPWDHLVVDPGIGFGKTPDHNLALLARARGAARARAAGAAGDVAQVHAGQGPGPAARTSGSRRRSRPRRSAIAAGVDIVRVHDVRENVRAARVADAILRGWRPGAWEGPA